MAAADEAELVHMVATAAAIDDRPSAFRYPRGEGTGVPMPEVGVPLEIGKGRIVREGTTIALLSFGTRLQECLQGRRRARRARPLDDGRRRALRQAARHSISSRLAREHEVLITIEEGSIGGFGAHVMHHLADARRARPRPQDPRDGAARRVPGSRHRRRRCTPRPGSTPRRIVAKVFDVLGQDMPKQRRGAHSAFPKSGHRFRTRSRARLNARERMKVILAQPRGFCAGVVRAIEIVERALERYGPPIYVRHEIVHNKYVVETAEGEGRTFVEDLADVPPDAHHDLQRARRRRRTVEARRGRARPRRDRRHLPAGDQGAQPRPALCRRRAARSS